MEARIKNRGDDDDGGGDAGDTGDDDNTLFENSQLSPCYIIYEEREKCL